jgi:large-conductance mechanosensitive channel
MHDGAAIATIIADAFGRMHAKFSNRIFLPFTLILISYAGITAIIPSEPKYCFV